ncbi:hypothetical protein WICMUC_005030 [Wickerhamomyces mucosus]|uniref:AB hydrolase-1 domain-containing protein n=1 Tax=Wickerhamomyces mucosus TaxID=1378264 RepID=A0A9P8PCC6_9ASCO|nr:hypothetical protein WICMUC_005030 [Wickerhamomyces mucosus]
MIQVRHFSVTELSSSSKKTLFQKIRNSNSSNTPNPNVLNYTKSTKLYFKWMFSNTTKLLNQYEENIMKSIEVSQPVKTDKKTVAGLHQISFENTSTSEGLLTTPTVLIHGHGASGIFFHRNFKRFSGEIQKLYTLDLPSIGLSTPKPFKVDYKATKYNLKLNKDTGVFDLKYESKDKAIDAVKATEDYYISALEEWRKENKLGKINLVSHSFGGLLSFNYGLKYPENVEKLVLVSPVGMEKSIFSINNSTTSGLVQTKNPGLSNYFRPQLIPSIISRYGFTITKLLGPLGIKLISKYLALRYNRTNSSKNFQQIDDFIHYTLLLFYQNSNSFQNLKVLSNQHLLALNPILDNIHKINGKFPVMLMYGQFDWMNSNAGSIANSLLSNSKFSIIENAGHNIFLDNPKEFNNQVIEFLRN